MKCKLYKKGLVLGIALLFIGALILPSIGGKLSSSRFNEENSVIISGVSNSATLSLYTFDKTKEKQKNNVDIPVDAANEINSLFEELKQKITSEPMSDETKDLKIRFTDLLDEFDLIPSGLSKDYVLSLLNPSWLNNKQKIPRVRPVFPVLRNFVSRILGVFNSLQQFFKIRFGKTTSQDTLGDNLPVSPYAQTGTATFCSMASGGQGAVMPLFLLPRPRGIAVWSATEGVTGAAELLSPVGAGFIAEGAQSGLVLGFVGLGLTFAVPGEMAYGFIGYALFTSVNAENIEFFPPNQEPVISDESPADGTVDVPLSLSELSFRIHDPEGKLMSYTVTTDPDIGGGSGILKTDGVYSVSVSGLEYDKKYIWTVEVTDDQVTAVKQYCFYTETEPFDPFDMGWQYRKEIIIDHTKVDGDLTSFPVLISTVDVDLRDKAQDDGDDILFMDESGVAKKIYHEIEKYDDSTGELVTWVRIVSLSSNEDTDLYMYYGNPDSINQQFPERVWNANYCGVWHLNENPSDLICDSTVNNNYGNSYGLMNTENLVEGKIGECVFFDGDDDYIAVVDSPSLKPESVSLQTFFKPLENGPDGGFFLVKASYDIWGNADGRNYGFNWSDDLNLIGGRFERNAKPQSETLGSYPTQLDSWYHLVLTFDKSSKSGSLYVNGIKFDSGTDYHESVLWYNHPWDFIMGGSRGNEGSSKNINHWFKCCLDEVRITSVSLDSDWILTEYNNQNDPSSFYNIGPEVSAP